jgi:hypothetical protein
MTREVAPVDINALPGLDRLVEEIARTGAALPIRRGDQTVAVLSPVRSKRRGHPRPVRLVDTRALPPVPHRGVDELLASRPGWTGRAFTDEEIKTALEEERVRARRRKSS